MPVLPHGNVIGARLVHEVPSAWKPILRPDWSTPHFREIDTAVEAAVWLRRLRQLDQQVGVELVTTVKR